MSAYYGRLQSLVCTPGLESPQNVRFKSPISAAVEEVAADGEEDTQVEVTVVAVVTDVVV